MSIIKSIGGMLLGGLLGGIFGHHKPPKALPIPSRDDARAQIDREDELRRRRGASADILTGNTGAEAALSGGKFVPGS